MINISAVTTNNQVEKRSWLLSPHGTEFTPSVNLDVSTFTAATHYPNGYLLSGIVLGKITATGKYGPYADTATDGTSTAVGILFSSVQVPNLFDLTKDTNGAILIHGFVDPEKLPLLAVAGALDANARVDLRNITCSSWRA